MYIDYKERSVPAVILGKTYDLYASERAVRTIFYRYGSIERLAEIFAENDIYAAMEAVWLLVLLANEGIAAHNINNPNDRMEPLDGDAVALLIPDEELAQGFPLIVKALNLHYERFIGREQDNPKNPLAG